MLPGFQPFGTFKAGLPVEYLGNLGENIAGIEIGRYSLTLNFPSDWRADDFILLPVHCDNADTIPTPSGWTRRHYKSYSPYSKHYLFYRFRGAASSVTLSCGDANVVNTSLLGFRGVDKNTPFDASAIYNKGSGGGSVTFNTLTTQVSNAFYMALLDHDAPVTGTVASGWSNASITGGAELIDISTDIGWDGGYAIWGGKKESPGLIPATTVNTHSQVDGCVCITMALRPE